MLLAQKKNSRHYLLISSSSGVIVVISGNKILTSNHHKLHPQKASSKHVREVATVKATNEAATAIETYFDPKFRSNSVKFLVLLFRHHCFV